MSRIVDLETIQIRPMTSQDLPTVCAIESRVYADPWSPELIKESLTAPMTHCLSAIYQSELAAYSIFQVIFTEAHLLNIAVHPDFQNLGLGRKLLKTTMERSRELGGLSFFLEVRPSNDIALKLYQKEGFRNLMVREKYYSNGEDAVVMMADLVE